MMRRPIMIVQSSWNAPWLRNDVIKSFSDFDSTNSLSGA